MKGTICILSACLTGMMLLAGCLWILNTAQAARQGSPFPFSSFGATEPKYILVDDFKDGDWQNNLGGGSGCWQADPGFVSCTIRAVTDDGFLEMQYDVDVITPPTYAVYYSELISMDLTALDAVWVAVKGENGSEPINIEFKDCGPHYPKELISDYLAQGIITSEWSAVAIPLTAFSDEITDWSCIDRFNIVASSDITSGQGKIYVDDIRLLPAQVLVDDFHDAEPENELGGTSDTWAYSGTIVPDYQDGVLELSYDVTTPTAAASYWTQLRYTNLLSQQKDALVFKIQGDQGSEEIAVEFKDCGLSGQTHYPKIKVSDYLDGGITTDWSGVAIPLAAFADDMDWRCVDQFNFHVSAYPWFNSGQGTVYIDDVMLVPTSCSIPLIVDHFDDCSDWNALIGAWGSDTGGTATIDFGPDSVHRYGNHGCGYRITYNVGDDSSAWVYSEMKGPDVTDYTHLRFFLKGAAGGEALHVYLGDRSGSERYYENIVAGENWQEWMIPLDYFSPAVDLTNLSGLKIAFEWRPMSGEVYLDNISFVRPCLSLPIVLKNYRETCSDSMPSCAPPYNNYEPNNFRCSTTFALSSGIPIQSYICAADDIDDYYYIDVSSLSPITIRLTSIPNGVDYDLYLYYGDALVARSDNYGNADELINYTPSQAGIYYIRVYPYSGYSLSPYTLQADFQ